VYRGGGASAQGADARYGLSYGADGEGRFGDRRSALVPTLSCGACWRPRTAPAAQHCDARWAQQEPHPHKMLVSIAALAPGSCSAAWLYQL
jgi:hypothetical protein